MPKPPLLVPPLPNETIASAAWGDPVTVAVNGLVTGDSIIGSILATTGSTQNITTAFAAIAFSNTWLQHESDPFFNPAGNSWVIPAGLNGLYRLDCLFSLATGVADVAFRVACRKNGTAFWQGNSKLGYGSMASHGCGVILPMADGDAITFLASQNGANQVMSVKAVSLIRIGDLP